MTLRATAGQLPPARNPGITRRQMVASLLGAGLTTGLTTTFATTAFCTLPAVAQDNPTKASLTFGETARNPVPLDYVGFSYETAQLRIPISSPRTTSR